MLHRRPRALRLAIAGGVSISTTACPASRDHQRGEGEVEARDETAASEPPDFVHDVAPIVHEHCLVCHRAGESAPFPLETFDDVKDHARQIAEVTESGFMPPWLPSGEQRFLGERGLTDSQRELLAAWAEAGAPRGEGAPPPTPEFPTGWQLGEPDLVLKMPAPYTLAADGEDVYRNFVLPVELGQSRFVKTVEFRPSNPKVVHHAVMRVDESEASARLDARESEPGYGGMLMGQAHMPDGQFLGWTPGKSPWPGDDDMAWRLRPGTDMVVQLHMRPTGKPETVNVEVGLYFATAPPRRRGISIVLTSKDIDIAAGDRQFETHDAYTLPVDVELVGIYPHAHYLGKDLRGTAILPGGRRVPLIHVPDWDFDWQDEYRYRTPLKLPTGTRIEMDFVYDNGAENPRNPFSPPRDVHYGGNSTDEMSELILQVVPRNPSQLATLDRHFLEKWTKTEVDWLEAQLKTRPDDMILLTTLGAYTRRVGDRTRALAAFGHALELDDEQPDIHLAMAGVLATLDRDRDALPHFDRAIALDPENPAAHNNRGNALRKLGRHEASIRAFERALELAPAHANAMNNLGIVYRDLGQHERAALQFERAAAQSPTVAIFRRNYAESLVKSGDEMGAAKAYGEALRLGPDPLALSGLAVVLATAKDDRVRDHARAAELGQQAAAMVQGRSPRVMIALARVLTATGDGKGARLAGKRAVALAEQAGDDDLVEQAKALAGDG